MRRPKTRQVWLDYMKAIAIILVILYHSMVYGEQYFEYHRNFVTCVRMMEYIHVPLFLVAAGYLSRPQNYKNYFSKKITKILVPFLVFTALKFAVNMVSAGFSHASSIKDELICAFLNGEYYWFVYPILFMFFILAPIIWNVRHKKAVLLVIIIVLVALATVDRQFTILPTVDGPFNIFNTLEFTPWFCIGMLLRQVKFDVANYNGKQRAAWIAGGTFILLAAYNLVHHFIKTGIAAEFLLKVLVSLAAGAVIVFVFKRARMNFLIKNISRYTLQLMFMDSFLKIALYAVATRYVTITWYWPIILAVVNLLIGVLVCVIAKHIKGIRFLLGL